VQKVDTTEAVLAHQRLAIIDVSGGQQPFQSEDGRAALVCNGEIYDHLQHRACLADAGYKCVSGSDCEVLLHLYLAHGPAFLTKVAVHGMFGFAIYDAQDGTFMAARDHVGIVSLYWGKGRNGTLWISSEVKCMVDTKHPDPPDSIQHFPIGGVFHSQTGFQQWYKFPFYDSMPTSPYVANAVYDALWKAVRSHTMSDVPFGVLLSGGLDSSLIAAITARVLAMKQSVGGPQQWSTTRLQTFCMAVIGNDSTDKKYAQKVADFIGSKHTCFEYTVQEVVDALRASVYHLETYDSEPVRNGAFQVLLAKRVKELGISVVLSGEGGDEVFAGYHHWKALERPEDVHTECVNEIRELHHNDGLRATKGMIAHSVELRVPYLDRAFLDTCMSFDPSAKMPGNGRFSFQGQLFEEKGALRNAATIAQPPLLPDEVLRRPKVDFTAGAGGNAVRDALDEHFKTHVTDEDLSMAAKRWPYCPPYNKEEYHYRALFEEMFGAVAEKAVPKFWRHDRLGLKPGQEWVFGSDELLLTRVS
jgi:asparagine synthase (glutamine-hydrolysing)